MESVGDAPFPRRNPRISDDTVFYSIHPDLPPDTPSSSSSSYSAAFRSLHLRAIEITTPFIADYIWQHEPFHLSLPPNPSSPCRLCDSPALPHLHGRTRYGDNLDDEWFIVFLLYQISRSIPSASIRVWDSDGEFLLIEAAFSLPRWINPDNSRHRVFIRAGELHIIPRDLFPSTPCLEDALKVLTSGKIDTRASDSVQAVLNKRISEYPDKAAATMHRARALVPLLVAQVLKHEPCLIALAVEGFYDRDVDSMKHAARMERFVHGEGGGIEMVRVSVRMSRAMYGQLVQQRFQAPRCYPMPSREEGPVAYAEAELGMKIACGFEMMYQERRQAGEEGKGATWDAFKRSLENSGCFGDLLPGSKEYRQIMDTAMEYYKNSSLFSRTREIMTAPVCRIDEILSLPFSVNEFNGTDLPSGDDDSWLYNGEYELNSAILERENELKIYNSQHKDKGKKQQNDKGSEAASESDHFNPGDIAETMQAFMRKIASFEGAEVPESRNSKIVELDTDQFMKEIESVMGSACREGTAGDSEETSSSDDMDFDESEDETELSEHGADDAGDTFMQSYTDALNAELNATTLKKSFIRANQHSDTVEGTSNAAKDMDEDLTPVDVDVNLVKSFFDSFSSQQGLPGPASNLLGLMGLEIPPDAEKK